MSTGNKVVDHFDTAGRAAKAVLWDWDLKQAGKEVAGQAWLDVRNIVGSTLSKLFQLLGGTVKLSLKSLLLIPLPLPGASNPVEFFKQIREAVHFDTLDSLSKLKFNVELAKAMETA